jgi:membrane-associated phospholipid phosphatase
MSASPHAPVASSAVSWQRWAVASLVAVAVAHLLDHMAWQHARLPAVYERDWGRLLRIIGFLPTWGVIALVFWLDQRGRPRRGAGTAFLLLAPTLGGATAEVLKLLLRRVRPDPEVFGYAFRAFADGPLSNRGMGLPSSHALVAFAGAFALARLFPRARWVFYLLALGCGLTRVLATAHYLSDVIVAACVAWGIVATLSHRFPRAFAREASGAVG